MVRSFFQGRQAVPPFLPYIMAVFFVTFVLSCTLLVAEEEEWRFVYRSEDINVHKRIKEESRFLEFKAIGNLHGEITEYINVLLDTDKMPDWAPQCFEAQNVEEISERESIIYVACNGVWPIADRDYIARRTVVSDQGKTTVRINIDRAERPNMPVNDNRIHIPHLQCCWILKRIDPAYTYVELRAYVDPGGWLPGCLAGWLIGDIAGYRTDI